MFVISFQRFCIYGLVTLARQSGDNFNVVPADADPVLRQCWLNFRCQRVC